ncbi:MAG: CRISPR-associated endonuclease Cas1 [Deltaproteobacteria bacterium]|nr:CRISPR-associated endonuclease Cas1 [Deltaproteobacteria bacterium]
MMDTVYIVKQGSSIHKAGYRLLVRQGGEVIDEIPARDLDQIILLGNVNLSPPVMDHLIRERIDTVFLSPGGRFRGRLLTQYSKNVELRRRQYLCFEDAGVRLNFSRAVVSAKVGNQRVLLLRHNRSMKQASIATGLGRMRTLAGNVWQAQSQNELMGLEGMAGRSYFSVFSLLIKRDDFTFTGRNRRPPRDPVNALLSFGYTILANAVETAVNIVGLDPYLGAFHSVEYGRPSLVCDLMEEFRAFFVDSLVITLLNKRIVNPDDFVFKHAADADAAPPAEELTDETRPVSMKPESLKSIIRIFEQKMASTVFYEPTGENITYRQVILNQARQCARFLLGKEECYKPFSWSH